MSTPDPWAWAEPVAAPQAGGIKPRFTAPGDPLKDQQAQTSIAGTQTNIRDTAHDNQLSDATAGIELPQKLRKEFYALPQVQTYQTIIQQTAAALKAETTPTGDQQLITAYAKALDPNSVVREGEFATVANADSAVGRMWAKLQKEGGFDNAGLLRPEVRDRVRRGLVNLANRANEGYNQQRVAFKQIAERNGLDPLDVIGPHAGEPYLPILRQYDQQSGKEQGQVNDPQMVGGMAKGTQVQFGGPDGPVDRNQLLRDNGIDPKWEEPLKAFWTAQAGNAHITPDAAAVWYAQHGIPLPIPEDLKAMVDKAKGLQPGTLWAGFDTSQMEAAYRAKLKGQLNAQGYDPTGASGVGNQFGMGATQGLADELTGVGAGLKALANDEPVLRAYREGRDRTRLASEEERAAHPALATIAELAGGALTAAPIAGEASIAGAVKAGAGAGALAGYGYGEGLAGSVGGAALGGVTGAALGAGAGKVGEALATRAVARAGQPLSEGAEVISAADRLNDRFGTNIKPIPADVSGPGIKNVTGGMAKFPLSAQPIVKGAQSVASEAEKAKMAIATMAGGPTTREAAGEAALTGAQKYIKMSKTKVDVLYAKARSMGGDEPVDLATARQVLDQNIAELAQTPGGAPGLAQLQALRAELDQPFPVEGVKRMRSTLRDRFLGDGLRNSDIERRVGQVIDAADTDVADSLSAAGKGDASRAYLEAAQAHRERIGVIDSVLAPIIGKAGDKSVEQVMGAIETATKTHGARLGAFLKSLPPDDAATVRATLINRMGMVSKGRQDADGTMFSLSDFLTHWNAMSGPAKSQLFGGELRSALEDVARVAEGTKSAQAFANHSGTGSPVGIGVTMGAGGLGAMTSHPLLVAVGATLQYGGGKLLAWPGFARWLAKMPANPAKARLHTAALSRIAANDTMIAADALGLQRQLMERFTDAPGKLAAQPTSGRTERSNTTTAGAGR